MNYCSVDNALLFPELYLRSHYRADEIALYSTAPVWFQIQTGALLFCVFVLIGLVVKLVADLPKQQGHLTDFPADKVLGLLRQILIRYQLAGVL